MPLGRTKGTTPLRKLSILTVLALLIGAAVPFLAAAPATATAGDHYGGPWFGADNFPPDCTRDRAAAIRHIRG